MSDIMKEYIEFQNSVTALTEDMNSGKYEVTNMTKVVVKSSVTIYNEMLRFQELLKVEEDEQQKELISFYLNGLEFAFHAIKDTLMELPTSEMPTE